MVLKVGQNETFISLPRSVQNTTKVWSMNMNKYIIMYYISYQFALCSGENK